jgi:hypothetical protein
LWDALSSENVIPDDYEDMSTEDIIQEAIDNGDLSLDAFEAMLEEADEVDKDVDEEEQTEGATDELKG